MEEEIGMIDLKNIKLEKTSSTIMYLFGNEKNVFGLNKIKETIKRWSKKINKKLTI